MPSNVRRPAFWVAVGLTGWLTGLVMEIASDRLPIAGLRSLVAYSHKGIHNG